MSSVLTDEERNEILDTYMRDDGCSMNDMCKAIERAVLAKAGGHDPIYMWRLEDDGWMECTKEWFESDIANGYEKRILYAHPAPQQAIPEWQPIETAPKDGSNIILGSKKHKYSGIGHYRYGKWFSCDRDVDMESDELEQIIGWYEKPTHWMPLPEPPKS